MLTYIARIPFNADYAPEDISNMYVFVMPWSVKSKKRLTKASRDIVKILVERGYWTEEQAKSFEEFPEESFLAFGERHIFSYRNVEEMAYTKYGEETVFQHDMGSFGTDTRKVFKLNY